MRMMLPSIVLVFTVVSLFACAGTQRTQSTPSVPPDLTISLGRGGGFSGMWEGVRIEQDSAVIHWSGLAEGGDERRGGTLTEAQVAEIWQRLNEDDLLRTNLSETGNMTSFIEVTANGSTHRISWEVGSEAEIDAAGAADNAYRDIMEIIDTVGR